MNTPGLDRTRIYVYALLSKHSSSAPTSRARAENPRESVKSVTGGLRHSSSTHSANLSASPRGRLSSSDKRDVTSGSSPRPAAAADRRSCGLTVRFAGRSLGMFRVSRARPRGRTRRWHNALVYSRTLLRYVRQLLPRSRRRRLLGAEARHLYRNPDQSPRRCLSSSACKYYAKANTRGAT